MEHFVGGKLKLFFDRDKIYPWPWTLADEVVTGNIAAVADGKKVSVILEEYDHGHMFVYCRTDEMDEVAKHLFERILRDRTFFEVTIENVHSGVDDFLKQWKERISGDMQSISLGSLIDLLDEYAVGLKEVRTWGWIPALIDGSSEPFLTNACLSALKEELLGKNSEEINSIFSLLSSPKTFGEVQKSEIEKWKLVSEIGDDGLHKFLLSETNDEMLASLELSLQKRLFAYRDRFSWLPYNYEGPVLSFSLLKEYLKGLTTEKAENELDALSERHKRILLQLEQFYGEHPLSDRTRYLIEIAQTFMILKEYRKSVYQQSYILADRILAELSRRLGCTLDELKFLSLEEMRSAIDDLTVYKEKAMRRRNGYMAVLVEDGMSRYLDGDEARDLVALYTERNERVNVKELHGQVAYPGKVQGIAKTICTSADLLKMEQGDILISSSTNPDLLPAIKKAGAIVTEMGGIICHAAIVARELQIPCVVGTKIALKAIKDGDRIEVDATNGVVYIL